MAGSITTTPPIIELPPGSSPSSIAKGDKGDPGSLVTSGIASHSMLVSAGAVVAGIAPSSQAGYPLVSNGTALDPSFSGTVLLADGSESAPSHAFSNAPGSGLWYDGTPRVYIAQGGKNVMSFGTPTTGGTWIAVTNGASVSGQNPQFTVQGGTGGVSFQAKGNWFHAIHAASANAAPGWLRFYNTDDAHATGLKAAATQAATFDLILPTALPASSSQVMVVDASGQMVFSTATNSVHGMQNFAASGTLTPAAGVYVVYYKAWGGGGGGGYYPSGAVPGSGGGSGGFSEGALAVTPGTGVSITVGTGGVGGTSGTTTGGTGGNTSVAGGATANGGTGGQQGGGAPGSGGSASGGTLNIPGKSGYQPTANTQVWGGDAPGGGGPGGLTGIDSGTSAPGIAPGGGGGGGSHNSGTATNGGAGANGGVLFWW